MVRVADGAPIVALGIEFATWKVALGPAESADPAAFVAVPAATDMPRVPSPVIPDMVTVRVVRSVPVTVTVPLAVPVLFRITLPDERLNDVAPV